MKKDSLASAVTVARALAHPARLRVVAALRTGELCVCQITEVLALAPSTVSAHLRELRRAGLVVERKEGRWVFFDLCSDGAATAWVGTSLASLESDPQLAADAALVEELRQLPVADLCRLGYDRARRKHRIEKRCT